MCLWYLVSIINLFLLPFSSSLFFFPFLLSFFFCSSPFQHRSTICAIRETEVVEMSRELFHIVAHSCPEVFQHVTQNLSVKFMEKNQRSSSKPRNENQRRDNIATIALLPITDHAPVSYLVQVRRKEKDNYSFFVVVVFTLFVLTLFFIPTLFSLSGTVEVIGPECQCCHGFFFPFVRRFRVAEQCLV